MREKFRVGRGSAGLGLFAAVPFRAGERVIEYTGERITTEEADRRGGRYLFALSGGGAIDATGRENLGRYANHACRPNCRAEQLGRRIFLVARRNIRPGEEITYRYGAVYFRALIAPVGCRCASCRRRAERAEGVSPRAAKAPPPPPPPAPRGAGSGRRAAPAPAGRAR